jgi:hypothetical protein
VKRTSATPVSRLTWWMRGRAFGRMDEKWVLCVWMGGEGTERPTHLLEVLVCCDNLWVITQGHRVEYTGFKKLFPWNDRLDVVNFCFDLLRNSESYSAAPINVRSHYLTFILILYQERINYRWSQWPCDLRHESSSPVQTLGSWVRIPLEAWMYVYCLLCR